MKWNVSVAQVKPIKMELGTWHYHHFFKILDLHIQHPQCLLLKNKTDLNYPPVIKHGVLEYGPCVDKMFLWKAPFLRDFPASRAWLSEGIWTKQSCAWKTAAWSTSRRGDETNSSPHAVPFPPRRFLRLEPGETSRGLGTWWDHQWWPLTID